MLEVINSDIKTSYVNGIEICNLMLFQLLGLLNVGNGFLVLTT